MRSLLILLASATAATAFICASNKLCDDLQKCDVGFTCAEKDPLLGIGKCCIDPNNVVTSGPLLTNFPVFKTTTPINRNTLFPITHRPATNYVTKHVTHHYPTVGTGNCMDKINPQTRTSDCPSLALYCSDSKYYEIMTRECPKTCGRCGFVTGSTTRYPFSTTRNTRNPSNCMDSINPSTGVSDCASMTHLCNDSSYRKVMREECPRTCGFCSSFSSTRAPWSSTSRSFTVPNGICQDRVSPGSRQNECALNIALCRRAEYRDVMRSQCPKTCGFC